MVRVLSCPDPADRGAAIATAVRTARAGRLVVGPVEGGRAVFADAFSEAGVTALRAAKRLPEDSIMGVLVGHRSGADGIAHGLRPEAHDLIQAFWPGPLGLLVRRQPSLVWGVPGRTFVVRMPLHPVALEIVRGIGPTVSSRWSAPDADGLPPASVLLDTGPPTAAEPPTLVDATVTPLRILRPGALSRERLLAVVPGLID